MNWRENLITDTKRIQELLSQTKTIAVLGIKTEAQSDQPAFYVPKYMQNAGYKIIPVPVYYPDVTEILGETVYRKLSDIADDVDMEARWIPERVSDVKPDVVKDVSAKELRIDVVVDGIVICATVNVIRPQ